MASEARRHRLPIQRTGLALPWYNEAQLINVSQLSPLASARHILQMGNTNEGLQRMGVAGWLVGHSAARALGIRSSDPGEPVQVVVPNARRFMERLPIKRPTQVLGSYKGVYVSNRGSLAFPNPAAGPLAYLVKHPAHEQLDRSGPEPRTTVEWERPRAPGLYVPTAVELYAIEASIMTMFPEITPSSNPFLDADLLGDIMREIRIERGMAPGELKHEDLIAEAMRGTVAADNIANPEPERWSGAGRSLP